MHSHVANLINTSNFDEKLKFSILKLKFIFFRFFDLFDSFESIFIFQIVWIFSFFNYRCVFVFNKTYFIKKCSLKSLNANDRSKKILINFAFVFFKVDKFNQYLIYVFNRNICQNYIETFQQRAIISYFVFQSTIIYDFHLFNQNCKTKSTYFNVVTMIKIDSLSQ